MNVYKSEYTGAYGGGMVLVAASSAEEALNIAAKESKYDYLFTTWDCELGEYVKEFQDMSEFKLVPCLQFNGEASVIAESIYAE